MSVNLKMLRINSNITLEELALQSGLTRSYLSKVERGLSVPSIAAALRIAQALNVSVEILFGSNATSEPFTITRKAVPRSDADTTQILTGSMSAQRMVAFVLYPGLQGARSSPTSYHSGEEFIYVLKGKIELSLSNRKEILSAGDSAHYNSTVPHKITSRSGDNAAVLVVVSPQGEVLPIPNSQHK